MRGDYEGWKAAAIGGKAGMWIVKRLVSCQVLYANPPTLYRRAGLSQQVGLMRGNPQSSANGRHSVMRRMLTANA